MIDVPRLASSYLPEAARLAGALPFPHLILEPFLDRDVLARVMVAFPSPSAPDTWHAAQVVAGDGRAYSHNKLSCSAPQRLAPVLRDLIDELHGSAFRGFLESLTGIEGLVPDPELYGGGLHVYLPGAHLDVHVDANVHPKTMLDRRLNLILYLNAPWDESWGGALELWSPLTGRCEKAIAPVANRCVVFAAIPAAQHGMSLLRCPPDVVRKSIFVRYYTKGRPEHERQPPHRVRWVSPHEGS